MDLRALAPGRGVGWTRVMQDGDEALVARYRRGDVAAFEELLERHRRGVFRFLARFVGDAARAEDLAQDCWMRFIDSAPRWNPDGRFKVWIYAVARNLATDESRRAAHRAHAPLDMPVRGRPVGHEPVRPRLGGRRADRRRDGGARGAAGAAVRRSRRRVGHAERADQLPARRVRHRLVRAEAEEAGRELSRYAEALGGDPEQLTRVEERLELLRSLARKHGGSLEAALLRRDAMREELARAAGGEERLGELSRDIDAQAPGLLRLASELTAARREAAGRFGRAVARELEALAMGRCRLEVGFAPPDGGTEVAGALLGPNGAERVEIRIAPNPGEPARPLARIASGGELSRILLAVKRALMRTDPVPTYVFDEVDAGIGGGVAEAVGRLLAEVSRGHQVICVTHLPQVAAFADHHHCVEKRVVRGRTEARVELLASDEEDEDFSALFYRKGHWQPGEKPADWGWQRRSRSLVPWTRRARILPL